MRTFALVWLKTYTAQGGSVILDRADRNKAWIGHPEYGFSPVSEAHDERATALGLRPEYVAEQRRELRARYEGGMRALDDLLGEFPGALAAIKDVVAICPQFGFPHLRNTAEA